MSSPSPEINQRLAQRRSWRANQDVLKDVDAEVGLGVGKLVDHPVDRRHTFPVRFGHTSIRSEGPRQSLRCGKALLTSHHRIDHNRVECAKPRISQSQTIVGIVIAVEEQPGVGRMVVALVKRLEIGVGQIRDVPRIAPRVEAIDRFREQRALGELVKPVVGRRVAPLHFVENHALVDQWLANGVEFVMPTFLPKGVRSDQRIKNRIKIDIDQVVEVPENSGLQPDSKSCLERSSR